MLKFLARLSNKGFAPIILITTITIVAISLIPAVFNLPNQKEFQQNSQTKRTVSEQAVLGEKLAAVSNTKVHLCVYKSTGGILPYAKIQPTGYAISDTGADGCHDFTFVTTNKSLTFTASASGYKTASKAFVLGGTQINNSFHLASNTPPTPTPIPATRITLCVKSSNGTNLNSAKIQPTGYAESATAPDNCHTFTFASTNTWLSFKASAPSHAAASKSYLRDGKVKSDTFWLAPLPTPTPTPYTVSGYVSGIQADGSAKRLSNISVTAGTLAGATTDSTGLYKLRISRSGTYTIRASDNYYNKYNSSEKSTSLPPSNSTTHFTLSLKTTPAPTLSCFTVAGDVYNDVNKDGKKGASEPWIQGAIVTLNPDGKQSITDANGVYKFPCIKSGMYSFVMQHKNYNTKNLINIHVPVEHFSTGLVSTATGGPVQVYLVSGKVTDTNGVSIQGATVKIYKAGTTTPISQTTTYSDGTYYLNNPLVPSGTYDLSFSATCYITKYGRNYLIGNVTEVNMQLTRSTISSCTPSPTQPGGSYPSPSYPTPSTGYPTPSYQTPTGYTTPSSPTATPGSTGSPADLIVVDIKLTDANGNEKTQFSVNEAIYPKVTFKNNGGSRAESSDGLTYSQVYSNATSTVPFNEVSDAHIWLRNGEFSAGYEKTYGASSIGPNNEAYKEQTSWKKSTAGNYTARVFINYDKKATEENYNNNQKTISYIVGSAGPTPTTTPSQPKNTFLDLVVKLHGVGNTGDNVNPSDDSTSNKDPRTKERSITIFVLDRNEKEISRADGKVWYSSVAGDFTGIVTVPIAVKDDYSIKMKLDKYISNKAPGFYTLTPGFTHRIAATEFIAGDVNNDNTLDILDFNLLLPCFDTTDQNACSDEQRKKADINDNGEVDDVDYLLLFREISSYRGV